MALRITSLNRMKNGQFVARKSIPADVREAYARLYSVTWEERLTLPANTSQHEAKTRHGEWLAECGFRGLRPWIPIERDHAFQSKAATCSAEGGRGVVAGMGVGSDFLGCVKFGALRGDLSHAVSIEC